MNAIIASLPQNYLGHYTGHTTPCEDHHGGGLWVMDEDGWFLVKNLAGLEWSQQFIADPAKVDMLRQYAQRLYRAFPKSLQALQKLVVSYKVQEVLDTPITTLELVSRWTDSIFNASVPLPQPYHTGVLDPSQKGTPKTGAQPIGGVHHYPTPVTDIQLFKRDDFQLWVVDEEGQPAAVVPTQDVSTGGRKTHVLYATPGTKLHKAWMDNHAKPAKDAKPLELADSHTLSKQAFKNFEPNRIRIK
jgi:hypothetical protein